MHTHLRGASLQLAGAGRAVATTMTEWALLAGRDAGTRVNPALDEDGGPLVRRREDSDEELFLTPKSVRESYVRNDSRSHAKRRAVPFTDALGPPVKLELGGSTARLVERASPRKSNLPKFHSEEELDRERFVAKEMRSETHYEFDDALPLPQHLQFLLDVHVAVEQSILVHMATSGAPAAEAHDDGLARRLRIANVIHFHTLRPMVERTLRRTFTMADFKRLVWVWSHAPGSDTPMPSSPAPPPMEAGGMGFVVSRARTIDLHTHKRIFDYGIGIEMQLYEPKTVVSPTVTFGSPGNTASPRRRSPNRLRAPSSPSTREEMSYLAMWNNGVDERRAEFHRRLCHFVAMSHDRWLAQQPFLQDTPLASADTPSTPKLPTGYRTSNGLLTPTATRSGGTHAQRIRHEPPNSPPTSPLAGRGARELPTTPPQSAQRKRKAPKLAAWHPDFALDSVPPMAEAKLPTLRVAVPAAPIVPRDMRAAEPAPVPSATAKLSLEERIRAKEQAMHAARHGQKPKSAAPTLHERSMLSRLSEMAEAIYLLFVSSNVPAQSRHGRTSRVLPLVDVLVSLENSAKVALSRTESEASVAMLMSIAPGWLERTEVGGQPWLRLCNDPHSFGLRHVRAKIELAKRDARTQASCTIEST